MIGGIAAAVAGVTVSGCEWGPDDDSSSDGSAANQNSARTGTDPDDALVDRAVADLLAAQAIADRAAGTDRAATRRLRDLRASYTEQLSILGSDPTTATGSASSGATATPTPGASATAGTVTVAEALSRARAVQGSVLGYAGQAASGDLARTFGAIAAGIAQAVADAGGSR